ncbi:MAG: sarcosine oxidase subunit delta [Deltaproteobacteria bacterium]
MRLDCPHCGPRDLREFSYTGAYLARPAPDAGESAWDDFVHLRDNPAGPTRDLWYHEGGCGAWLVVSRNTLTHAITKVERASEAKP